MARDYRKEFRGLLNQCRDVVENHNEDSLHYVCHISFTAYGKKALLQQIESYKEDAGIDYQLDIIDEKEFNKEMLIAIVMKNSVLKGEIY